MTRYGVLGLVVAMCTACSVGAPIRIATPDAVAGPPLTVDLATCAITLGEVTDSRDSSAAGTLHGRAIDAPDLPARVRMVLESTGIAGSVVPGRSRLDVEIVHAYGQGKSTSMSFTTVLRGRLEEVELIARAVHTGINWSSTNAEVSRGLLRSVDNATERLIEQVQLRCERGLGST